jgi:curved DNA-binding protein CbpA
LGIAPLSTADDINRQYKKLAKKFHPDANGGNAGMEDINKAYGILKEYVKNFKFTFSEDEILKQYPQEFLKKFKV